MKNNSHHRLLAPYSSSTRLYADNHKEFMRLCDERQCKPADLLREAFDEWLEMRRAAAEASEISQCEEQNTIEAKLDDLQRAIDRLTEKAAEFAESFDYVKRRDHGYLLEIFMAAYGARDLVWRQNISGMYKGNQTQESISLKYQELQREWEEQAIALLDRVRETIQKGRKDAETRSQPV